MAQQNFILGRGELLTFEVTVTRQPGDKVYPYTFEEAVARLSEQFSATSGLLDKLPVEACPGDIAVELVTLNPAFIAKSYFPEAFLAAAGLTPIGSRSVKIKPDRWTKKGLPQESISTQLFVAGRRDAIRSISQKALAFDSTGPEAMDYRKVEAVGLPQPLTPDVRLSTPDAVGFYEIGLHLLPGQNSSLIQLSFLKYAKSLGVSVFDTLSFLAGNLWFVPARGERQAVERLALFSFVRVVRPMPHLRGIPGGVRSSAGLIKASLPVEPPIAQDVSVAIMDGGLPTEHPISPWLRQYHRPDATADDVESYNDHGLGVTSAFLFGPLEPGKVAERPYAPVSHVRILDKGTDLDDPLLLYRTLGMIEEVLLSRQYQFLNLSLGPDLPIDDEDVHAWTSVIDEKLSDGMTFMSIAVGNNGEMDRESGNARIQVPSDCVNAVAVGAADSQGGTWSRAPYSAMGPGRSPGLVKPDLLAFGGNSGNYFHVLSRGRVPTLSPLLGTSFASPFLLRIAVGVRAFLGDHVSILAIKALMVHCAEMGEHPRNEVGWGRVPEDVAALISCPDGVARIVYQGELRPGKYLRAPIPLPSGPIAGMVTVRATLCYASEVDPEDSGAYTRSGLDVTFRPHKGNVGDGATHAKTKSFFQQSTFATEDELRADAGKWETVLHSEKSFRSATLSEPSFDIHYNARENGGKSGSRNGIRYALIVTIMTPKMADIGAKILGAYPQLVPIQPRITLPVRV